MDSLPTTLGLLVLALASGGVGLWLGRRAPRSNPSMSASPALDRADEDEVLASWFEVDSMGASDREEAVVPLPSSPDGGLRSVDHQDGSAYMRAIVETAPDAIIATQADGTIEWTNQATVGVFGSDRAQLAGHPIARILPSFAELDIAAWMAEFGIAGRVIAHITNGRRVDGTPFPCAVSSSTVRVDGESHYTFIVRDTSDSKWAENELRLREAALESAGDGVVISSMTLPGEPIIYANPAFLRMSGYSRDEVIGTNCRFLQGADTGQQQLDEIRRAIREQRGCRVILRNYRKDGTLFWNLLTMSPVFAPEGHVSHYVGVQSDITSRMEQEEVLRLRTERLNTVFDLSPDGFVAVDGEGIVRIVNPAFAAMTGFDPRELVGQPVEAMETRLASKLSGIDTQEGQDSALLHLSAPTARTLLRRTRRSAEGQETVMYFRDMTRELEVDRMKSEFLSMAAHELRTPMASIFGFTELLLKRKFDDARRQDMLATIHRQSQLLINLVNELLDLARIEARRGSDFRRRVQPFGPIVENMLSGLLVQGDDRQVAVTLDHRDALVDVD